MHYKYTTKNCWEIKPGNFQYAFLSVLGPQNKDHVNKSDNQPTYNRLQSSKLIKIWLPIASETNKRNTNVDQISNENTCTNL
jgi:hypothetical protein